MPPSKLDGRVPAEVVEHEYDGARLVRSVTWREPEWTEQDYAEIAALAEYRDGLCPCCGFPKAETLGDEADAPTYMVSRRYCHARKTMLEAQDEFAKAHKPQPRHAAMVWAVRAEKR